MINFLKRAGILWCLLLFFYTLPATENRTNFVFSANCIEAEQLIKILKLDRSTFFLEAEHYAHTENVAVDLLEDYRDFYRLITCQRADELHRLEKYKDQRIARIKESDKNSPYYLYAQAEIQLHWAFARIFHKEYVKAAFEFRDAYKLLVENEKKFPSFHPDEKSLGMLKAMLGTIPENFRWILSVIGMTGNYREGVKSIKNYLDRKNFPPEQILDRQSAEFYYTFMLLNFGDRKECWNFCKEVTSDYETNLFSAYLRAFTGIKCMHNEDAITACSLRPRGNDYTSFYVMDFLLGQAKLNRLDKDADVYLKRFVSFYKGQNLVKDAYKRLSWYSILENDTEKYRIYLGLAGKFGTATSDEDKIAQSESAAGIYPDIILLRSRLLFDGGYFSKAEDMIKTHPGKFKTHYQEIEYHYRYGRIMQESAKTGKAIESYNRVLALSENDHYYFAPNSCLQLGFIYLKLGYREMARTYFEKTLTYKNYEYHSGISQQAKEALNELD
ncbi:MAG: tol-pal system YbgF family protein [Bacteroidia bacterium]